VWKECQKKELLRKYPENIPEGEGVFGNPRRLLDDIEDDLKKTGVRDWRRMGRDRIAWKLILKVARIPRGEQ
jgi:hypothetical protein